MNTIKKYEPKEKVELHGTLAEFRQALEEEIEAVKKRGQSSILLTGGVQISNQAGKYCYKYNADFVPVLPADTPCKLIIGQNQYTVTTVSFDEETITLASEQPLPDGFSQARLENGSTVLMECMIKCIEENASETNPAGKRMFNVAVTRAKFQLFIIGDFEYCMERTKKSKNNLHDLLRFLIDEKKYPRQEAKTLFPELSYTPPTSRKVEDIDPGQTLICTDANFNDHFMRDLKNFQNRMIIYSAFMSENRLSVLLPVFTDAVSQGKEIIIVTKDLSERGKVERGAYERCEKELRSLGDKIKIIHKHGMHEKLILVDDDVVWMGSLNALSFTGKTGEVMERRCSKKLVKEYEKMYDIPHISQALNSGYEMACPICGGEMLVRESDEGGIYWQCVNKDYSRSAEQPYPKDGILRCHCGSKYAFSMKKEPRWICESNPRHYQKMRESDLKLEQMKSLIPRRELKTVEKYFSERRKEREQKSGKKRAPKIQENQQITLFD